MAKDGPLHLQKRQDKQKVKRKNQESRLNARAEKLQRLNPLKLWSIAQSLQSRLGQLSSDENKQLESLQRDLRDIQKLTKWRPPVPREVRPEESIYYHAVINPSGAPPPGYGPHRIDEFEPADTDEEAAAIPMPPPRTQVAVKAVYESEPQLRASVTDFKPRTI